MTTTNTSTNPQPENSAESNTAQAAAPGTETSSPHQSATSTAAQTPPPPNTPTQIIHGELAVELYELATTGKSARTAVNPAFPPDNYPIIFRQYADKLSEAIDNYLRKPVKDFKNETFPNFREPAPLELARSVHLDEISPEDQERIYQWTEQSTYDRTLQRLPYPPPIGLSIKTTIASLQRLRHRRETQVRVALSTTEAQQINAAENSDQPFIAAAQRLLRVRALETALKPDSKTSELRDLFQILDRIHARAQSDRKLAQAAAAPTETSPTPPVPIPRSNQEEPAATQAHNSCAP